MRAKGWDRTRAAILVTLALLVGASGVVLWWSLLPRLRVFVDPALSFEVDWPAFRDAFHRAGVWRVEVEVMGSREHAVSLAFGPEGSVMAVALVAPPGRNPLLTREALRAGKTGPGGTDGRVAAVYPEEIARFMGKHRDRYTASGTEDWLAIRQHLFTNTAVHEVWHAVANSHSHNPMDMDSVMYIDPGRAAVAFGTRYLDFTRGHRERLQSMFAPLAPGADRPFER